MLTSSEVLKQLKVQVLKLIVYSITVYLCYRYEIKVVDSIEFALVTSKFQLSFVNWSIQ